MNKLSISDVNISQHLPKKGVVVVPTYYLTGKKALALDRLVKEGIREHELGKTTKARSLKEALKIYKERDGRRRV